MDSSSSLFRSTLLVQKKICPYGGEIFHCGPLKHWKAPNWHQNYKPEACECYRQHKESAPLSSALCLAKISSEVGADVPGRWQKWMSEPGSPRGAVWASVSALGRQQTHRREAWAAALAGMGEKLLLNILDFLGRQGLHLGWFQITTAALEGSSGLRGDQIRQKSDCARPLVCVWPEKGQLQEGLTASRNHSLAWWSQCRRWEQAAPTKGFCTSPQSVVKVPTRNRQGKGIPSFCQS